MGMLCVARENDQRLFLVSRATNTAVAAFGPVSRRGGYSPEARTHRIGTVADPEVFDIVREELAAELGVIVPPHLRPRYEYQSAERRAANAAGGR